MISVLILSPSSYFGRGDLKKSRGSMKSTCFNVYRISVDNEMYKSMLNLYRTVLVPLNMKNEICIKMRMTGSVSALHSWVYE